MTDYRDAATRCFTVEQANAMLPLVRAITEDLVSLGREVFERRQRLEYLKASRKKDDPSDPYMEELLQVEEELERQTEKLRGYVRELEDLGVEPKSATEGLIDFPAVLDGRPVFLCWKLGEPEVMFWHDLESGFAGRQPIPRITIGESDAGPDAQPPGTQ